MTNTDYKPTISSAFSLGRELQKKASGPMIGYWFLLLFMMIIIGFIFSGIMSSSIATISSSFVTTSPSSLSGSFIIIFIIIIAVDIIILGFWLGYYLYMNGVYKNGEEEFGTFFKGIKYAILCLKLKWNIQSKF